MGVASPGRPPTVLRSELRAARRRSLEFQREQVYRTGFPGHSEIGHAVVWRLRRRNFSRGCALYAGFLAAVGSTKNWMGNPRLAKLTGFSVRQVQRFRRQLEDAGLIRSESLEAGDLLDGMRAPAWRPWTVRDVTPLQQLAAAALAPERKPRKPSAAEVSHTVETTRATAADFGELAARVAPEFATFFHVMAASAAKREQTKKAPAAPLPADAAAVDPSELDRIDRELAELSRGPPPRGS